MEMPDAKEDSAFILGVPARYLQPSVVSFGALLDASQHALGRWFNCVFIQYWLLLPLNFCKSARTVIADAQQSGSHALRM